MPVSMGVSGVDIILSPSARRLFDLIIECKNHEKLNVVGVFTEHAEKYKDKSGLKLLVHSRNRSEDLVTMRWADFTRILVSALAVGDFPFSSLYKNSERGLRKQMEQKTELYLKSQLKKALLSLAAIQSKLRESENRNLGLIAENNKLHAILRTRREDANQEPTS